MLLQWPMEQERQIDHVVSLNRDAQFNDGFRMQK